MPDVVLQFGNIVKKYQSIVAMICGVASMSAIGAVAWHEVKADTEAMRERIKSVELKVEKDAQQSEADHDLLIRIDANVSSMNERLKRIEGQK
jgi:hypothetical protein